MTILNTPMECFVQNRTTKLQYINIRNRITEDFVMNSAY